MQQIKQLVFRLANGGMPSQPATGVFSGADADAHVQKYLSQGYTLHTVCQLGAGDSEGVPMYYCLVKDVQAVAETFKKAQ